MKSRSPVRRQRANGLNKTDETSDISYNIIWYDV